MKLVQDLGEETFPEPNTTPATSAPASSASSQSTTSTKENSPIGTIESQEPLPNESTINPNPSKEPQTKPVTTQNRKPMAIPSTIHVRVTSENLKDYVGPPIYQKDRMYATPPPPGVSTGLGYLGNGSGAVMPIEAMSMPGKGSLQLTGKLGEVIRESANIGLSYVKAHAFELGITKSANEQFLTERDIHVHMPEGGIGKEGPSAGTAILTAFVSLFKGVKVNPDIGTLPHWFPRHRTKLAITSTSYDW